MGDAIVKWKVHWTPNQNFIFTPDQGHCVVFEKDFAIILFLCTQGNGQNWVACG